jgi:hypothetical protein
LGYFGALWHTFAAAALFPLLVVAAAWQGAVLAGNWTDASPLLLSLVKRTVFDRSMLNRRRASDQAWIQAAGRPAVL